ncbi:integrase arm-type DNA-binding domain-containing protein [Aurantimonas sp. E1-2-R+4]|uniref:tyrosine-type recombinase/integrase n=1 Tax=Aurantimonas sp. E1-2-R+4 TaxID=3113714 RepID=UPI002F95C640
MARNLLTTTKIKASVDGKLSDGDGLWLHRNRSGNRSWVFIYRRNGRRREMGLGALDSGTAKVGLAAARMKADEIREILGRGGDPFTEMGERQSRAAKVPLFGAVADDYVNAMAVRWKGARTENSWRLALTKYAKPIRKLRVDQIETPDIIRCLRPIWETKTETATKVRERIKMILDHAKANGWRTGENPAQWRGHLDQILPPPESFKRTHFAAMPYTELPGFISKIRGARGIAARALELIILTAVRSGEGRGARWSEMDLDRMVWTIPAERMKGAKPHRVPLSPRAAQIVRDMAANRISEFVFPSAKAGAQLSDMAFAKTLKTYDASEFTTHGFRSSFRSWVGEETTFQREVAEAALAHSVGDVVERAYSRGDALEKRRALMDAWANFCEGTA